MGVQKNFERSRNFIMGGLCSKKKIADAETENNENEENTDKTPVGERRPTKGAGLLGKTEWTDDEDEEEESVAENAPALVAVDNTPASEEAPVAENQAEETKKLKKKLPKLLKLMRMLKYLMNPYKKQNQQTNNSIKYYRVFIYISLIR